MLLKQPVGRTGGRGKGGGLLVDRFVGKGADHVPDPYYGGQQGFEEVADLVEDA